MDTKSEKPEITIETNHHILVKCHTCGSWTYHRVFYGGVYQFGLCDAHNNKQSAARIMKTLIQE